MKNRLFLASLLFALTGFAKVSHAAEVRNHKVIFELATDDEKQWGKLLNNVENALSALGEKSTAIEIVAHGGGLKFLIKDGNMLEARMRKLFAENVKLVACENTMKRQKIEKRQLLDFVITTDSGVAELVRQQENGWVYLHSGS
jgi:intracellular sulfur oxidation DsrE/DsrF family protein